MAAAAAIVGAIYAVRGFRRQVVDAAVARARHEAAVQPRPRVTWAIARGAILEVTYANPGGAATMWQCFIWHGDVLFQLKTDVPAHYQVPPGGSYDARRLPRPSKLGACVGTQGVCSLAKDVEGNWWDCATGERLPGSYLDVLRAALGPHGVVVPDETESIDPLS